MTKTRSALWLVIIAVAIWGSLTMLSRPRPRDLYILQADWDAIQATVTYSVGTFTPEPILVDDDRWDIAVHAKPGELITLIVKPHLPGHQFKTHCFIRNFKDQAVGYDEAAWDENNGTVLCSVIAT